MSISEKAFEAAKEKIIGIERDRRQIGTLSEKTVHAVLKNYYEPDEDKQEIPIEGMFADIFTGTEIVEIQTRNFDKLREKLNRFLPLFPVTIVLPIPSVKWLIWIDESTGEITEKRKSPKKGTAYDAFKELYKIKPYLKEENLTIKLIFLELEEYRVLDGWSQDKKRGSHRYDRIPQKISDEKIFSCKEDYMQLVPDTLPEQFTSADFAKAAKISGKTIMVVMNILHEMEVIKRVGKKGRSYLYEVAY